MGLPEKEIPLNPFASVLFAVSLLLAAAPAHAIVFERADIHQGQIVAGFGYNGAGGLLVGGSYGVTPNVSVGGAFFQNFGPSVAATLKLGETPFGLSYGVTVGYVTIGLSTPNPTTGLAFARHAGVGIPFAARLGGPDSPLMVRGNLVKFFYPLEGGTPDAEWMNTEIAYRWGALEFKTGTRSPIGIRLVF